MLKIAGRIIDLSDDSRFMSNPEFRARFDPVFEWEKIADMPKSSFALVLKGVQEHRKYAVHNKIACQFSACYFKAEHAKLHPVFQVVTATFLNKASAA